MIELTAALAATTAALEDLEIGYVVVGSTAAATWGVARSTRDVDLVVLTDPPAAVSLAEELAARDDLYVPMSDARHAAEHGGSFNVLHPSTGGKVDVFVVLPGDAFTESRVARRQRAEVLGVECWVATPEDVVLAKLRWRRESRSEVQWRDCVEIVTVQPVDRAYLRHWAPRIGVVDDLEDLLGEVPER